MKYLLLPIMLLLSVYSYAGEEEKVKECYGNYKEAIMNDDGAKVVPLVSNGTVKYYDDLLNMVHTYDSTKVAELGLMDKMSVLAIRHKAEAETIKGMKNGKDLLIYAIDNGMVGKESIPQLEIGKITVDGNDAQGEISVQGQTAPFPFRFKKEDGNWKFDVVSLTKAAAPQMQQAVAQSGMAENDFVMFILEYTNGKKPDNTIWQPVN